MARFDAQDLRVLVAAIVSMGHASGDYQGTVAETDELLAELALAPESKTAALECSQALESAQEREQQLFVEYSRAAVLADDRMSQIIRLRVDRDYVQNQLTQVENANAALLLSKVKLQAQERERIIRILVSQTDVRWDVGPGFTPISESWLRQILEPKAEVAHG